VSILPLDSFILVSEAFANSVNSESLLLTSISEFLALDAYEEASFTAFYIASALILATYVFKLLISVSLDASLSVNSSMIVFRFLALSALYLMSSAKPEKVVPLALIASKISFILALKVV